MQELIIKMVICLLVALALGFLFGWLLKRAFANEKYSTIVDKLEADLIENKNALKRSEDEATLIKEQFLNVQNELETSSLKTTELEDKLSDYNAKLSMLGSNIQDRESRIQEEQKENSILKKQLEDKHNEHEKIVKESANQNEMINRVKEHHTLLKDELTKLKEEKLAKDQEIEKLSIMIDKHKANEIKLLDEKKAQEGKVSELKSSLNEKNMAALELGNKVKEIDKLRTEIANYKENEIKLLDEKKAKEGKLIELESILNEKKIAAIELHNKAKEMDTLKQRNSALSIKLNKAQTNLKEAEEGFFDKLEQTAKQGNREEPDALTEGEIPTKEGSTLMKFVKKALHYVTDTSDEINKNADEVIKEYKNKQR